MTVITRAKSHGCDSAMQFVLFAVVALGYLQAVAQASEAVLPTPEQLVAMVQASRAQYRTLDVEFRVERYRMTNDTWPSEPEGTASRIFRTTFERGYSRAVITEKDLKTNQPYVQIVTHSFTPNSTRKLVEEGHSSPMGVVQHGLRLASEVDLDVARAVWAPYGEEVWTETNNSNATVQRGTRSGYLVLNSQCFSPLTRVIEIDTLHGYLPIRQEIAKPDGKRVMWCESRDLRQVDGGLWLPYHYTAELSSNVRMKSEFIVEKARVNAPLADAELDLTFPRGTVVHDEIADLTYEVGKNDIRGGSTLSGDFDPPTTAPSGMITVATLTTTRPISDAQLSQISRGIRDKYVGAMSSGRPWWITATLILGGLAVAYVVYSVYIRCASRKKRA